jgi:hypothetical protein
MRRNYDIFERFPDGSSVWHACVSGQFEAQRKIQELAEHSKNEFFAVDLRTHKHLTFSLHPSNPNEIGRDVNPETTYGEDL